MAEAYIGEIRMFAGGFAPQGWALCNGQLLPINQNMALFSLLGTNFGGDGQTNFALPDLQGRVPINWGNGNGLSPYVMGQSGGVENVNLTIAQTPPHSHTLAVVGGSAATTDRPSNAFLAQAQGGAIYSAGPSDGATLNSAVVNSVGGGQPHTNQQPYLAVTFIIALQGIYPPRS